MWKVSPNSIMLWSQELRTRNRIGGMECIAAHTWTIEDFIWLKTLKIINFYKRSGDMTTQLQELDCREEINFVCTLADESHSDVCSTRCTPNGRNLCKIEKSVRQQNIKYLRQNYHKIAFYSWFLLTVFQLALMSLAWTRFACLLLWAEYICVIVVVT